MFVFVTFILINPKISYDYFLWDSPLLNDFWISLIVIKLCCYFCPGARPENNSLPGLTNNLPPAAKGIDLEYEPEGKLFNLLLLITINVLITILFNSVCGQLNQ